VEDFQDEDFKLIQQHSNEKTHLCDESMTKSPTDAEATPEVHTRSKVYLMRSSPGFKENQRNLLKHLVI